MNTLCTLPNRHGGWPLVILAGLALVAVAVASHGLAALTGVALVGLGSVGAVATTQRPNQREVLMAAHGMVYGLLYLVFLGATLDLGGWRVAVLIDLVGSVAAAAVLARRLPLGGPR